MKTIILYFSYSGDAELLARSVQQVRRWQPSIPILVADDASDPMPQGVMGSDVHVFKTRYDRGGTGKGLAAVLGELRTMRDAMLCAHADYCIKLDPDCYVRDLRPLLPGQADGIPEPDFLGCEGARALLPMGCAYRISRWGVQRALEYIEERKCWQPGTYAEALTIWHVLALTRLPLQLLPADVGYLQGFRLSRGAVAPEVELAGIVHCGEPYMENNQAMRASRELAMTRMAYMRSLPFE